ncbi:hypothetical protein DA83_10295 [Pseudomonas sp. 250J]|uniref:DUF3613 domain-containing protein n=1 Tax=Pseudomonas peradeniyensis TaxID=2745488 RepID=A0ABT2V836_9PSED|nr:MULTISPECIES: DUF3613 domain-containing protein [Pseudomonas]KNX75937.1 hypothetical protein DA83_10295 [Pseudomonas sp. 250J]MCU7237582.1 DUF3613 domain-containing protein [Pseudomonas peradeniyensis]MCU7279235.1 DUF3613 domain-containing protein [Pseudomonas peradeniyensis]QZA54310.1 DUF3613 domain-containing protein [Pseudomonas sp. 2hn]
MKNNLASCLGLLLVPLAAQAIEPGPSSEQQQQTEDWLVLQSHGQAMSPIRQTAAASERDLALQRWLESYKHAIPEYYKEYSGGQRK